MRRTPRVTLGFLVLWVARVLLGETKRVLTSDTGVSSGCTKRCGAREKLWSSCFCTCGHGGGWGDWLDLVRQLK